MRRFSERERRAALLTAIVLAGVGVYIWIVEPPLVRQAELRDEVAQLRIALTKMRSNIQLRDRIENQYAAAQTTMRQSVSPSQEMARFARLLSDLYTPLGVQMTSVRPLPDVQEQYYAKYSLRLEMAGSVADVAKFLAAVAQVADPIGVEWMELTCKDQPGVVIASLIVTRIVTAPAGAAGPVRLAAASGWSASARTLEGEP